MPTTANKGYNTPTFNSLVGTWGTGAGGLNETFQIQDNNMGGIASVALSNTNVTLSASQAQNLTITLTGTLTANVIVKSPCIGFFFVVNNTTGNFTVTLQANFGAGDIGSGLVVPNGGLRYFFVSDTTSGVQYAASPASGTLVGEIKAYAGSSAPTGWVLCYGQAISRTIYAALFAVIGTTYGVGDGSSTFNVPDLRGRTLAGLDNMGGSDAGRLDWSNTLGTTGGEQYHTQTTSEMPVHNHGITDPHHSHTYQSASAGGTASGAGSGVAVSSFPTSNTGAAGTGITINNTGSGNPFNVMQPTLLCNWILKY